MRRRMIRMRVALAMMSAVAAGGCGLTGQSQEVNPDAFYVRPAPVATASPIPWNDRPGELAVPNVPPPNTDEKQPPPPDAPSLVEPPSLAGLGASSPATMPATQSDYSIVPATQPGIGMARSMELGAVVATVGTTPIYADQIIRDNALRLRNAARSNPDIVTFRDAAAELIQSYVKYAINDELQYTAANKALDADDHQLAQNLTALWRQDQINEAGGSPEVARRQFAANGQDFEEETTKKYRSYLTKVFYVKKVWPNVNITAADVRDYYQKHLAAFSTQDVADAYIIEVDPAAAGGPDQARALLEDLRKKIAAGADAAQIAGQTNTRTPFKTIYTVHRDSLALRTVEATVWATAPGQVSDVFEDTGRFYIVKVVDRTNGGTKSFDDEAVQNGIANLLRTEQENMLENQEIAKLDEELGITSQPADENIQPALDIALQNYPEWSKQ